MINALIQFVREQFRSNEFIPLHAPIFSGRERDYVADAIETTFVSSVGAYVDRFEGAIEDYTGCGRAVATVNGTAALHVALKLAGVQPGDLVLTQPLTFIATCNSISYLQASPVFVDVDRHTMGLSPKALGEWLSDNTYLDCDGHCRLKIQGSIVRACVVMHTFGHPAEIEGLLTVCANWNVVLVEDAAESLGSLYKGKHTGTLGALGTLSFNGNKIITTGGGGMILSDKELGSRAKHLTTTAKIPHPYEYVHDEIGYNYRLPNLNAALGCAQLEQIEQFIQKKRALASSYDKFFLEQGVQFFQEPKDCRSNYWLNAVICPDREQRNALLKATNENGVMTRPVWALMNDLPMYNRCLKGNLSNAEWLADRVVNLPSSVVLESCVS